MERYPASLVMLAVIMRNFFVWGIFLSTSNLRKGFFVGLFFINLVAKT